MSDLTPLNTTLTVKAVIDAFQSWADPQQAEDWDPVGLQIGSPQDPVGSVLLALDVTPALLDQAQTLDRPLILVHHPPLFDGLTSLRTDWPVHRLLIRLAAQGISVFAAHTNLDVASGGVADSLAVAVAKALGQSVSDPPVALGRYGRLLALNQAWSFQNLCQQAAQALNGSGYWLNAAPVQPVSRLAVFPGAFDDSVLESLLAEQVDGVLCGEYKHSAGLALAASGIQLAALGHDVSERVVLPVVGAWFRRVFPGLPVAVCDGLAYNQGVFRVNRTAAGAGRKAAREESPGSAGQGAG